MLGPSSTLLLSLLLASPAVLAGSFSDWREARSVRRTGVQKNGKRVNPYAKVANKVQRELNIRQMSLEPTKVGPAKRQATGTVCEDWDFCCYFPDEDCCANVMDAPAAPPAGRRSLAAPSFPGYSGEILSPENAVRFIMSPWGTYEHTNGTWIYDHHYARDTKRILERKAKRGMVGRFFAETLGASLLTVIPRPIMIRKLIDILQYRGGLFTASSNTAILTSDIQPTLELLLAQPGFDGFSLHGYTYPKTVVQETLEVLRTMDASGPDAYAHADAREDELERRMTRATEKPVGGRRGRREM